MTLTKQQKVATELCTAKQTLLLVPKGCQFELNSSLQASVQQSNLQSLRPQINSSMARLVSGYPFLVTLPLAIVCTACLQSL
ncbi:hypothetical protein HPP92_024796 [Vanilla planifolia]|uniref:Uncharacterized protein n=1 Tax=Vanilla planifolia TaxID=51239 RepID=A0A835PNR3_VANPL|nr:hypothetical protein HPP92_024796 [Vanilla planifolia]